ncbi:MAG: hypothetical protein BAJALOKI3v1_790019 [Promethearchaeota archaeon]|nr:MAG: hypothetical protein BAJALOKI3v1_790019 [Candidatus Lokiarchaeota archaeon]
MDLGGSNYIFIGEIFNAYADEICLTNSKPDMQKIKPIAYSTIDMKCWTIGKTLAKAYKIGKKYRKKLEQ